MVLGQGLISSKGNIRTDIIFCFAILYIFIFSGDHTTGVWVGGSDNGHVGRWAWFPTGNVNIWLNKLMFTAQKILQKIGIKATKKIICLSK